MDSLPQDWRPFGNLVFSCPPIMALYLATHSGPITYYLLLTQSVSMQPAEAQAGNPQDSVRLDSKPTKWTSTLVVWSVWVSCLRCGVAKDRQRATTTETSMMSLLWLSSNTIKQPWENFGFSRPWCCWCWLLPSVLLSRLPVRCSDP